jgi:hypothetical protein
VRGPGKDTGSGRNITNQFTTEILIAQFSLTCNESCERVAGVVFLLIVDRGVKEELSNHVTPIAEVLRIYYMVHLIKLSRAPICALGEAGPTIHIDSPHILETYFREQYSSLKARLSRYRYYLI